MDIDALEHFPCDRARCHISRSQARRCASTAEWIMQSIFLVICESCMAGTICMVERVILFFSLVSIPDEHTDWCAGRLTLEHAREYLDGVCFCALCRHDTLSRTSAIEFSLD